MWLSISENGRQGGLTGHHNGLPCSLAAPRMLLGGRDGFLTISSLLACRVHLAPSVPLAKMALTESLAPLGLLVPVDVQAKLALL